MALIEQFATRENGRYRHGLLIEGNDNIAFALAFIGVCIGWFQLGVWWREMHPRVPPIRDSGDPSDCNERECADGLDD